jgi:hypothetical protein
VIKFNDQLAMIKQTPPPHPPPSRGRVGMGAMIILH